MKLRLACTRLAFRTVILAIAAVLGVVYMFDLYRILDYNNSTMNRLQGEGSRRLDEKAYRRQQAVRSAMQHAWAGYQTFAFGKDEYQPVSNKHNDRWGGWAITLVDSLDTLKIMELEEEYHKAKAKAAEIDFGRTEDGYDTPVFEMVIRALGGLLGAYELDNDPMFIEKARQVGDILLLAFDTPTGMPWPRVIVNERRQARPLGGSAMSCLAEVGTIQMEYYKLAELTQNDTYRAYADRAINAVLDAEKYNRGLYPTLIDVKTGEFSHQSSITLGGMADSFYEYLLKLYLLDSERPKRLRSAYIESVEQAKKMLIKTSDIGNHMYIGRLDYNASVFSKEMDHLSCFYPGLLALGSQALGHRPEDLRYAEELTKTCYLSYKYMPTGLGPEKFTFAHYGKPDNPFGLGAKLYDRSPPKENRIILPPPPQPIAIKDGMRPTDYRYLLRPETVESLFVMYRVTGDKKYQDWGWDIFVAIEEFTKTPHGYAAYINVMSTDPVKNWDDSMESFFLAETLKYLYLLFSPTDVLPLDQFVFNTEAHPFRIIK